MRGISALQPNYSEPERRITHASELAHTKVLNTKPPARHRTDQQKLQILEERGFLALQMRSRQRPTRHRMNIARRRMRYIESSCSESAQHDQTQHQHRQRNNPRQGRAKGSGYATARIRHQSESPREFPNTLKLHQRPRPASSAQQNLLLDCDAHPLAVISSNHASIRFHAGQPSYCFFYKNSILCLPSAP